MEDFLGTSIQFAEKEIKRLEEEHANKMEQKVQNLIAIGFLDSDFDGSSGRYSSDSDTDDIDNDDDDDDIDNDHLFDPDSKQSKLKKNVVDNFGIHSDKLIADDIMMQISMEKEYEPDDDDDDNKDDEEEEEEKEIIINDNDDESSIIYAAYYSVLIEESGSDYYLTSDMNEESEFYHGDIDKNKESEIKKLLFQQTIIINNNTIYQIIAEYIPNSDK